jgi:nucleoside-diphosphate-sugar epimerase
LMKVLVTGGAGYLGSVLALRLIQEGHDVRVADSLMHGGGSLLSMIGHPRFEFVAGDVRDTSVVRRIVNGVDAVVHLAAIVGDPACSRAPELARAVNVEASAAVIDEAQRAGVQRFVFASTCSNYGRMTDTSVLATEDHELRPLSLYAESKVEVERRLLGLSSPTMMATVLRLATLFGLSPRMRFDLTVNEFVMEMLVYRRLVVYGEQFWRPYVHVREAARAIATVLEAPANVVASQVFNVGHTDENYRKLDLVEIIRRHVGEAAVDFVAIAEDPRDYKVSFERIRSALGFVPTIRVPDGVAEIAGALSAGVLDDLSHPRYGNVPRRLEPVPVTSASGA